MAARGYYLAFQAVKKSVSRILNNENPGTVVDNDHGSWYRELSAPSIDEYMTALEAACMNQNIMPFTDFLAKLVNARLEGKTTPAIPSSK